ncbi:unnamed protein product, partial [Protopolystoma xenopodis]
MINPCHLTLPHILPFVIQLPRLIRCLILGSTDSTSVKLAQVFLSSTHPLPDVSEDPATDDWNSLDGIFSLLEEASEVHEEAGIRTDQLQLKASWTRRFCLYQTNFYPVYLQLRYPLIFGLEVILTIRPYYSALDRLIQRSLRISLEPMTIQSTHQATNDFRLHLSSLYSVDGVRLHQTISIDAVTQSLLADWRKDASSEVGTILSPRRGDTSLLVRLPEASFRQKTRVARLVCEHSTAPFTFETTQLAPEGPSLDASGVEVDAVTGWVTTLPSSNSRLSDQATWSKWVTLTPRSFYRFGVRAVGRQKTSSPGASGGSLCQAELVFLRQRTRAESISSEEVEISPLDAWTTVSSICQVDQDEPSNRQSKLADSVLLAVRPPCPSLSKVRWRSEETSAILLQAIRSAEVCSHEFTFSHFEHSRDDVSGQEGSSEYQEIILLQSKDTPRSHCLRHYRRTTSEKRNFFDSFSWLPVADARLWPEDYQFRQSRLVELNCWHKEPSTWLALAELTSRHGSVSNASSAASSALFSALAPVSLAMLHDKSRNTANRFSVHVLTSEDLPLGDPGEATARLIALDEHRLLVLVQARHLSAGAWYQVVVLSRLAPISRTRLFCRCLPMGMRPTGRRGNRLGLVEQPIGLDASNRLTEIWLQVDRATALGGYLGNWRRLLPDFSSSQLTLAVQPHFLQVNSDGAIFTNRWIPGTSRQEDRLVLSSASHSNRTKLFPRHILEIPVFIVGLAVPSESPACEVDLDVPDAGNADRLRLFALLPVEVANFDVWTRRPDDADGRLVFDLSERPGRAEADADLCVWRPQLPGLLLLPDCRVYTLPGALAPADIRRRTTGLEFDTRLRRLSGQPGRRASESRLYIRLNPLQL